MDKIIQIMTSSSLFTVDELTYVSNIRQYQLRIPYTLRLTESTIIQHLNIGANYVINPWILFTDFTTFFIFFIVSLFWAFFL